MRKSIVTMNYEEDMKKKGAALNSPQGIEVYLNFCVFTLVANRWIALLLQDHHRPHLTHPSTAYRHLRL